MAFGFTPKFEQSIELNGFDPQKYLAIAVAAAKKLDWKINYTSRSGFIAYIGGGVFATLEEFKLTILHDTVYIKSSLISNGMYDWGKNKKHVNEFIETFGEIESSANQSQIDQMLAELTAVFESTDEDIMALPPPTAKDNLKSFLSFFTPRPGYFITPIIIDINLLIFILMALSGVNVLLPGNADLIKWGADFGEYTLQGQWWRLLTNVFIHVGIMHILFNMYALLYIGILLEPHLGKLKFTTAYLFTGIIASLTSMYWHPLTISAGASGAIFGMYGVFLAMLTTNFIDKSIRKPLLTSIGVFVVFNLLNGAKEGIDNAAHVGGLVSGLLIGYSYYPSLKSPAKLNLEYITISIITMVFVLTSFVVYKKIPNDIVKYDAKIKLFSLQEEDALQVFKEPKTSTNTVLLSLLDAGIINWNKNIKLLNEADKLNVPVELLVRDNKLKEYCNLRIKSYQFIEKSINENTSSYNDSIKVCTQQIQKILDDFKQK